MFACPSLKNEEPKYTCILQGVGGQCYDQKSKFICNNHAEYFGLRYIVQNYMTATNESFTKIHTCLTTTNFNIPFFIDSDNIVDLKEIESFAHNIAYNYRGVNINTLINRLSCLYANQYPSMCNDTWLDGPNISIAAQKVNDDNIYFVQSLPLLVKLLLYYVESSNVYDDKGKQVLYVPNLTVVHNPITKKYCMKLLNPSMILKYHDKENVVVTPLVLHAYKKVAPTQDTIQSFRPIIRAQC